ncbi:hypothetical protein BDZ97DRAFT_1919736 [Flammula alnicola]|nr:hypothetical protein BDZ97DRAFT_1919736 [Flammula alnicola]
MGDLQPIDDRDPLISYSGTWEDGGVDNEYNKTTTWTNWSGSTAKITFSGTSISVWGTIAVADLGVAPHSSYSVDDGPAMLYEANQSSTAQYRQQFFQSGNLSPTNHTLLLTTLVEGAYFYLDYALITPADTSAALNGSSSSSSLLPSSSPSITTTTRPATSTTPLQSQPVSSSSEAGIPVGAIVGGSLGGLALIMFTIIAFLLLKRKKNGLAQSANSGEENTTSLRSRRTASLTPFVSRPYPRYEHRDYLSPSASLQQMDVFGSYPAPSQDSLSASKVAALRVSHIRRSPSAPNASNSHYHPHEAPPPRYSG